MSTLTEELVDWTLGLKLGDVPADVEEDARLRILDTLGCIVAAMETDVAEAALAAATGLEGKNGNSRVIGYGDYLSEPAAALVNGTMAHALDYDDTHPEGCNHVSAPAVATAVAVGDSAGVPGERFLLGVIVGRETSSRMSLGATPGTLMELGFHPTSLIGTISSALLAGRLLGLDREALVSAMGIAGSQAAGILQAVKDGTWSKILQPGWAAHSAVWAAALARQGVTGPHEILEGEFGIFRTHVPRERFSLERITHGLGGEWESRTVNYKPYPCGSAIHPFIDAALRLQDEHSIPPEDISSVRCLIAKEFVPTVCEPAEIKLRPESGYHAKFSLYYGVALALLHGRVTEAFYTDSAIRGGDIRALTQRVAYEVDDSAPALTDRRGWVIVNTVDGRSLEVVVDDPLGTPENPFKASDVNAKFEANVSAYLSDRQIGEIYAQLDSFSDLPDVRTFVAEFVAQNA